MITKVEEKIIVPAAEAIEKITYKYKCDLCDFETESNESAQSHHGKLHAAKDKCAIGDQDFLFFEDSSDLEAFVQSRSFVDITNHKWDGVGWYGLNFNSQPCPRG